MDGLTLSLDRAAMDSTLSYFINQLDVLDPRLYEPLVSVSWQRDIKLRSDVSIDVESTSFIQSNFGVSGTLNANGIPWVSDTETAMVGISVDGERQTNLLRPFGYDLSYSFLQLQRSQRINQPIDVQKMAGMNLKYQMDVDRMVYLGDPTFATNTPYGLVNSPLVSQALVANDGTGPSRLWINKTPTQILRDINELLSAVWATSAWAFPPDTLLLPPDSYAYLNSQLISTAGSASILQFIIDNNISKAQGINLKVEPVKWLLTAGESNTRRMVAYTNAEERVRFPLVPIQRLTPSYQGMNFHAPYLAAMGGLEFVYPETLGYRDGF